MNWNDIKPLPTWKWLCLFGAYLEKNWDDFERMCEEWDVSVEFAKHTCMVADRKLPRRHDDNMNRVISKEEAEEIKKKWGYYE